MVYFPLTLLKSMLTPRFRKFMRDRESSDVGVPDCIDLPAPPEPYSLPIQSSSRKNPDFENLI